MRNAFYDGTYPDVFYLLWERERRRRGGKSDRLHPVHSTIQHISISCLWFGTSRGYFLELNSTSKTWFLFSLHRVLGRETAGILEVEADRTICIEEFKKCKSLGRVALRDVEKIVAAGIVTKVCSSMSEKPLSTFVDDFRWLNMKWNKEWRWEISSRHEEVETMKESSLSFFDFLFISVVVDDRLFRDGENQEVTASDDASS